ncbi:MAG TPA: hypothetical protein VEH81_04855 [Ktedonobacteraceae bacterium]|nr:hypothetical protein [Ktedonobacteraceae bacterium]
MTVNVFDDNGSSQNKRKNVGADLSGTTPIHRPFSGYHDMPSMTDAAGQAVPRRDGNRQ